MMPQKRNPDMLELIRGRCGNVYGDLFALMTILKGLPIGYNRDLQEDKRHVFQAYDTVSSCLTMAAAIVNSANFIKENIEPTLDKGFLRPPSSPSREQAGRAPTLCTRGLERPANGRPVRRPLLLEIERGHWDDAPVWLGPRASGPTPRTIAVPRHQQVAGPTITAEPRVASANVL